MAERISYPDKSNNPSAPDSENKFFATEADEIKAAVNAHADDIEALQALAIDSSNPYYGRFTSLALLEATHPIGEEDAFAIIDAGPGITPQIAAWDNLAGEWEIVNNTDNITLAANKAAFPPTGASQQWYIALDTMYVYVWNSGEYKLTNPTVANLQTQFTVVDVQDDTIPITEVAAGKIAFEYDDASSKMSAVVFNTAYTDKIQQYVDDAASTTYYLVVDNKTKNLEVFAKITGFTTVNTDYTRAALALKIPSTDVIDSGDVIEIRLHIDVEGAGGSGMLASTYDPANKAEQMLTVGDLLDEDDMSSDSATKAPSQQSVKAFVNSKVAGLYDPKGGYDASTNTPDLDTSPSGILKGDAYTVTVAGTFFTEDLEVGDVIIAEQDDPTLLTHWTRLQKNLDAATIESLYNSQVDVVSQAEAEAGTSTTVRRWTAERVKQAIYALAVKLSDFLEEKLNGTADEALTVTGATNVDLSAAAHRNIKLTGNATLTFTNTPAVGKTITRTYNVRSTATETLGIANSTAEYGAYVAATTKTLMTVMASNTSTDGLEIHVLFSQPN